MNELDKKDRKILLALDMDARAPEVKIARSVGLSKQSLNYRIRRLEEKKIILSYYPVVDHTKLGLKLYRMALKLENLSKDKESEIMSYLRERSSWLVSVLGKYDLFFSIYVKDEYEFMSFWHEFHEKYSYYIKDKWVSLMARFYNFERSFIFPENSHRDNEIIIGDNPIQIKIDDTDTKILKELSKNARQSSLQIAEKIKETERVVRYRIKSMRERKVILGYRTFLDISLLKKKYYKLFINLKDIKAENTKSIKDYIKKNPNVIYSTEALGGYDFELEAHFTDTLELADFITRLREKFPKNIKSIEHMEYLSEFKVSYFPRLK